jgi:hypothetical protein
LVVKRANLEKQGKNLLLFRKYKDTVDTGEAYTGEFRMQNADAIMYYFFQLKNENLKDGAGRISYLSN